jgi:hypothetical protein
VTRSVYLATHPLWCNAKPKHNLVAPKSSIVGEISFLIVIRLLALLGFCWSAMMAAVRERMTVPLFAKCCRPP